MEPGQMVRARVGRGVPTGGRYARMARQEAALPQELTGEPDTDAQFCVGVAQHIAQVMRIRERPKFERTSDGAMLAKLELGPRSRPYTVRISGSHVTVWKLSQDQRNNPYEPEALATSTFEVLGGSATPAELADMIVEVFEQTSWWQ